MTAWEAAADEGALVAFVGAGCSMMPPTSLPSWWDVNRATIEAMAGAAGELLKDARAIGALVVDRQQKHLLPPEYFAEILASILGGAYFDVLRSLDSEVPNATHLAIARLAEQGRLRAILTTNFDRAVEAAFRSRGAPLDVRFEDVGMKALAADLDRFDRAGAPCVLLKLHGCASEPASLIDTLSQRKRGLPAATNACLHHLVRSSHWLFLGYSGADLEADPNYLTLRAGLPDSPGFTWLVRAGTEPLAAVRALAAAYGPKSELVFGELPQWLESLTGEPSARAPLAAPTRRGLAHADAWARDAGGFACALALALLAEAAGETGAAADAMNSLKSSHPLAALHATVDSDGEVVVIRASGSDADEASVLLSGDESSNRRPLAIYVGPKVADGAGLYAVLCTRLALLRSAQGQLEEAEVLMGCALAATAGSGDVRQIAWSLGKLGGVLRKRGNLERATSVYDAALQTARTFPDVDAALRVDVAPLYVARGRREDAAAGLERAVEVFGTLGDEVSRADALGNLANLSSAQDSLARYAEVVDIAARLGDEGRIAYTKVNLGKLARSQGDVQASARHYADAETIAERIGDRRLLAMSRHGVAVAHDLLGYEDALVLYDRALEDARGARFPTEVASILNNIGRLQRDRRNRDAMRAARREALEIYRAIGDPTGEANTLYATGSDAIELGEPERAIEPLRRAQQLFDELSLPERSADAAHNLAFAQRAAGEEPATSHPLESIRDATSAAQAMSAEGRHEEAEALLQSLLQVALDEKDFGAAAATVSNLGVVAQALGHDEDAARRFRRAAKAYVELGMGAEAQVPLHGLVDLLQASGPSDELADAVAQLADAYDAAGDAGNAAALRAYAAGMYLQPFADGTVATAEEAGERSQRARELLHAALPMLPDGEARERALYDLNYSEQVLGLTSPGSNE